MWLPVLGHTLKWVYNSQVSEGSETLLGVVNEESQIYCIFIYMFGMCPSLSCAHAALFTKITAS